MYFFPFNLTFQAEILTRYSIYLPFNSVFQLVSILTKFHNIKHSLLSEAVVVAAAAHTFYGCGMVVNEENKHSRTGEGERNVFFSVEGGKVGGLICVTLTFFHSTDAI